MAARRASPGVFTKPVNDIVDKTFDCFSDHTIFVNRYIYRVNMPGCATFSGGFVRSENFSYPVTNSTLPALIDKLFPSAVAPKNYPRNDLMTVLLKRTNGLDQLVTLVSAAELMRLNTEIPITVSAQNPLGVTGSDNFQQCVGIQRRFLRF